MTSKQPKEAARNYETESVSSEESVPATAFDNDYLSTLTEELGIDVELAEQSLKATNFSGVEDALEWISEHQDDEVPQSTAEAQQQQLTPEEALYKATELQKRIREERIKREKKEQAEAEKRRIEVGKQLAEAQRALTETAKNQSITQQLHEKKEFDKEKARQLKLTQLEWEERFGKEKADALMTEMQAETKKREPKDEVLYHLAKLSQNKAPEALNDLLICLNTLSTYITNVETHPFNKVYWKINKNNTAFKSRVLTTFGDLALAFLKSLGFQNDGDYLQLVKEPNLYLFSVAARAMKVLKTQLETRKSKSEPQ